MVYGLPGTLITYSFIGSTYKLRGTGCYTVLGGNLVNFKISLMFSIEVPIHKATTQCR